MVVPNKAVQVEIWKGAEGRILAVKIVSLTVISV